MPEGTEKTLTVNYLPTLGIPPKVYRTHGKAGYHVHSNDSGAAIGYRIYVDNLTVLIPAIHIFNIEVVL